MTLRLLGKLWAAVAPAPRAFALPGNEGRTGQLGAGASYSFRTMAQAGAAPATRPGVRTHESELSWLGPTKRFR